ncbi:MAG: hypothetical protein ACU841_08835 [Gammaproteobacteria bacterium]
MFILIVFFLFMAALSLFLTAELFFWLAFPILPGTAFGLGALLLLSALGLLFLAGLFGMANNIVRSMRRYFSRSQRLRRRLLFVQGKKDRIERLVHFRKLHIRFFHELKIKRLLNADDRKHNRSLSKAARSDLFAHRKNPSSPVFRELQRALVCCCRNRQSTILLRLQQKLADRV